MGLIVLDVAFMKLIIAKLTLHNMDRVLLSSQFYPDSSRT